MKSINRKAVKKNCATSAVFQALPTNSEKESVKARIKEGLEDLKGYSKHPEHVAVADSKVRPFTASRACLDFEI